MTRTSRILAIVIVMAPALRANGQPARPAGTTLRPKIRISHETTRILGPLCADGYVDYARALDEKLKRGVTPDNNAVALLWQVFGPKYYSEPPPESYFKSIGISRPPEKGRYFTAPGDFLKIFRTEGAPGGLEGDEDESAFHDEIEQASEQPWSRKDYPIVDAWLGANLKPMEVAAAAARRTARPHEPRRGAVGNSPDRRFVEHVAPQGLARSSDVAGA